MLDLVYLALVAAPLTIAAAALLVMALRSLRGHAEAREQRRAGEIVRAKERPGGMRRRSRPLAEPPSIASLPDVRGLGRSMIASLANDPPPAAPAPARPASDASFDELSALVEALAHPPRTPRRETPRPQVGAAAAATKHCPDCAEEILAAARVCKHCRYRFDEPGDVRISV